MRNVKTKYTKKETAQETKKKTIVRVCTTTLSRNNKNIVIRTAISASLGPDIRRTGLAYQLAYVATDTSFLEKDEKCK